MMNKVGVYEQNSNHIPVLLDEVIEYMNLQDGGIYVDGTFGFGGYSKAILSAVDCKLYAIDRDPNVVKNVRSLEQKYPGSIELLQGNFGNIANLLGGDVKGSINAIVLDLGVSSMQLDQAERGFSFMREGPLDMRMSCSGASAEDFINNANEEEIANVIYEYGGERKSRKIARKIVEQRSEEPISTTTKLAEIIRSCVPGGKDKIDPATRSFQAIRIHVNDELGELKRVLEAVQDLLASGGRFLVVSFHSLEDKIVKDFFNKKAGKIANPSRYLPQANDRPEKVFEIVTRKPITPSEEELQNNVRSRSAKLRVYQKLEVSK